MNRRRYDLVFGLGGACCCSKALRQAGLQYASFPYDWVSGSDLVTRARLLTENFPHVFSVDALEPEDGDSKAGHAIWRDRRNGIAYVHDFRIGEPLEDQIPVVRQKYRRRADRLNHLIGRAACVLVVWVDVLASPLTSAEDGAAVLSMLRARWPGVTFDLLRFSYTAGVAFEVRQDVESGGVRTIAFDYQDKDPLVKGWVADFDLLAKILAGEYEVADYRTAAEKHAWAQAVREKERLRFKGTGWWSRTLNRLEYKLYRHLQKFLTRKGLIG